MGMVAPSAVLLVIPYIYLVFQVCVLLPNTLTRRCVREVQHMSGILIYKINAAVPCDVNLLQYSRVHIPILPTLDVSHAIAYCAARYSC